MKNLEQQKGQTAIEFIIVIVLILFFLFFFLSLSIVFVVSDYLEYATFMTARTYKSMVGSKETQQRNALAVWNSYAGKVNGIATNFDLTFLNGGDVGAQGEGVRGSYDMNLFYLPPIFLTDALPFRGPLRFSTETRLGRDPSSEECLNFFNSLSQRVGLGIGGTSFLDAMEDNGC